MSCTRAQEFLAYHHVEARERVDARKVPIDEDQARKLLETVDLVIASKGKKVLTFDLTRRDVDLAQVVEATIGPTGNLRAPAIRKGRTLLVGFSEDEYRRLLS